MDDYRSPSSTVFVGAWQIAVPPRWRVRASRTTPLDVATIELDNASGTVPAISKGDSVQIWQGWRESGERQVFGGQVDGVEPGRVVRLECSDAGRRLATTQVVRSWLDATPQEIVEDLAAAAGIQAQVELRDLPRRHRYLVTGQALTQAIRGVLQAWGVPSWDCWCVPDGSLYVGPWERSPRYTAAPTVQLERGGQILNLRVRDHRAGWCETLALPGLEHSRTVTLIDSEFVSGPAVVRLDTVTYLQWPNARTELEWTKLN